jgi:6-phosphogluconolactonase (cycloisomerase 2 family)
MRPIRACLVASLLLLTACPDPETGDPGTFVPTLTVGGFSSLGIGPGTTEMRLVRGSPFVPGNFGLVVDPRGRFAYALALEPQRSLWGVTIDPSSGALAAVPGAPYPALMGTYALAIDPGGRFLYAPNQSGVPQTCLLAHAIDPITGALAPVPGSPYVIEGSNCWSAVASGDGRFLYVVDHTQNAVNTAVNFRIFGIDPATGALTPLPGWPRAMAPAANFGLAFVGLHPGGRFLYTVAGSGTGAGPNLLSVLDLDRNSGEASRRAEPDVEVDDAEELVFHPEGRLALAVAPRGFRVYLLHPDSGSPQPTSHRFQTDPRPGSIVSRPLLSVGFDPTGAFVVVGDSLEDAVVVLAVDADTGALQAIPGSPFAAAPR